MIIICSFDCDRQRVCLCVECFISGSFARSNITKFRIWDGIRKIVVELFDRKTIYLVFSIIYKQNVWFPFPQRVSISVHDTIFHDETRFRGIISHGFNPSVKAVICVFLYCIIIMTYSVGWNQILSVIVGIDNNVRVQIMAINIDIMLGVNIPKSIVLSIFRSISFPFQETSMCPIWHVKITKRKAITIWAKSPYYSVIKICASPCYLFICYMIP